MASHLYYLLFLILLIPLIPLVMYLSLFIYKHVKQPHSSQIPLPIRFLDPVVQAIFLLSWKNFRKIELMNALQAPRQKIHSVKDVEIETEEGNLVKIRIYRPNDNENLPIVVYYHGGGFAIGSIESTDPLCRELSNRIECVFVSVEYRLAPEFPFPQGFNDSYDAMKWTYKNARSIGGDPNRIAIMGESAGANFSAGITLKNSDGPIEDFKLVYQVLIYPSSDLRPTDTPRPSKVEFHHGWFYSSKQSKKFRACYFTDAATHSLDYRASPLLYKGSMARVPDAFVLIAAFDPLRDEGMEYIKKLQDSDINVRTSTYNITHGFFDMKYDVSKAARSDVVQALRQAFTPSA